MYHRNKPSLNIVSIARSSTIKGSPQKINLVIKMLRGKKVSSALLLLKQMNKASVYAVSKTLLQAISNAENNNSITNVDSLFIRNITVGKAYTLKRFHPRARGRIFSVSKHYSKIYLELHHVVEE